MTFNLSYNKAMEDKCWNWVIIAKSIRAREQQLKYASLILLIFFSLPPFFLFLLLKNNTNHY